MRLPDPARSQALLIGCAEYDDPELHRLPAVRNNVLDLHELLTDTAYGSFAPDHCAEVIDPSDVRDVGEALERSAAQATDTLMIYFAGHGLLDSAGQLYLGIRTTGTDRLRWTGIPFSLVRQVVSESPAENRVVILDCCFSGRAIEAMGSTLPAGQLEIAGTYTLTSVSANTPSAAPRGAVHTAFTGELVKALRDGIPDDSRLLTLGSLHRHLVRVLTARGLPGPQCRGTGTSDLLALAPNRMRGPHELAVRFRRAAWVGEAGDPAGAAALFHDLVAEYERVSGNYHPDTLTARQAFAHATGEAGDAARAAAAFEALVAEAARVFGEDHPRTLGARHEQARWTGEAGHHGRAAELFRLLAIDHARIFGPDSPETLGIRWQMARWTGHAGSLRRAAALFERLVADYERVLGPEHPDTAAARRTLSFWTEQRGPE